MNNQIDTLRNESQSMAEVSHCEEDNGTRLPVVIVLDTSLTMNENGKISVLNEALLALRDDLINADLLNKHVELSVVSCGGNVSVLCNFVSSSEFVPPTVSAEGSCLVLAGLLRGMALIDQRKAFYKKNNMNHLVPIIILIEGTETADFSWPSKAYVGVINEIRRAVVAHRLRFFPMLATAATRVAKEKAETYEPRFVTVEKIYNSLFPPGSPPKQVADILSLGKLLRSACRGNGYIPNGHPSQESPNEKCAQDECTGETAEVKKEASNHFVLGASVAGPLHIMLGIPCQDAFDYMLLDARHSIFALADGLGSKSKSEIGSRVAVEAATTGAAAIFQSMPIEHWNSASLLLKSAMAARKALEQKAEQLQCDLKDLACTLIVVAMNGDEATVAHVGDGAVVAQTNEGLKLLSVPGDSEYANEVMPITGNHWERYLRVNGMSGIRGFMALTDGCQRAALRKSKDGYTPSSGFCEPIFEYAAEVENATEANDEVEQLLLSQRMKDNSADDKTLVVVVQKSKTHCEGQE